jgi:hypothetical protein
LGKRLAWEAAGDEVDLFGSPDLNDIKDFNLSASVPYQLSGKTSLGPSLMYRHRDVANGSNIDEYELGLSGSYKVSGKTNLTGTLGYNVQNFNGKDSAGNYTIPTWRIAGSHQISDKTTIRGSFYSNPKSSYNFDNAGYLATGITLSGSHQYSERTTFYAMGTYENDHYYETDKSGLNIGMNDNYYSITLGSSYMFNNGIRCGTNVTWRTNVSRYNLNNFDNLTFGLNASYNFW